MKEKSTSIAPRDIKRVCLQSSNHPTLQLPVLPCMAGRFVHIGDHPRYVFAAGESLLIRLDLRKRLLVCAFWDA